MTGLPFSCCLPGSQNLDFRDSYDLGTEAESQTSHVPKNLPGFDEP
jgi:hypothetical protein